MSKLQECIPCGARIIALLELHPNVDLLATLENDLKAKLEMLTGLTSLLNNLDIYRDYCAMLELLNFMCIPDLQRLLALMMALLAESTLELDGLIGLLQSLVAPMFTPIFMGIVSLLDQLALNVLSPVDCIIDALNAQGQKLGLEVKPGKEIQEIQGGIAELKKAIIEGKQHLQNKLQIYIEQLGALIGEGGTGDISYLKASLKKLTYLRLAGFIKAFIVAISKGQNVCSRDKGKGPSELDVFFNDYLSPGAPFNFIVDDNGKLTIKEKDKNLDDSLSKFAVVGEFEETSVVNEEISTLIQETRQAINSSIQFDVPCKFKATEDTATINKWIEELNSLK